jgi:hypothetical protein
MFRQCGVTMRRRWLTVNCDALSLSALMLSMIDGDGDDDADGFEGTERMLRNKKDTAGTGRPKVLCVDSIGRIGVDGLRCY